MRSRHYLSLCSLLAVAYLGLATFTCDLRYDGRRLSAVTSSLVADAVFSPVLYVCNDTRYGWAARGWLELFKEPTPGSCLN